MTVERFCYTVGEAAEATGMSTHALYRLINEGLLHTVPHLGKSTKRIGRAELERVFNVVMPHSEESATALKSVAS